MSRYFDLDKLSTHKFTTQEASHNDMGGAYRQGWNDAIDAIVDNEPSQPEMIRCKECIYFDKYIDCKEMYQWDGFCADWARNTYENWYCSRAERRNE